LDPQKVFDFNGRDSPATAGLYQFILVLLNRFVLSRAELLFLLRCEDPKIIEFTFNFYFCGEYPTDGDCAFFAFGKAGIINCSVFVSEFTHFSVKVPYK